MDGTGSKNWKCELCRNEVSHEAFLNQDCLLCPRTPYTGAARTGAEPTSFLRACKPTEGQGWAHILCAVFIPDLTFSNATRLRLVEGISTIAKQRWVTDCDLCQQPGGAVIRCPDCPAHFHVSCAWNHGYRFGFEMVPIKNKKDLAGTVVLTLRGETGVMTPVISCRDHPAHRRPLHGICDSNDLGETALQLYCRLYKQAPIVKSHGLLRKAQRLDHILEGMRIHEENATRGRMERIQSCHKCGTTSSPAWYPALPPPEAVPESQRSTPVDLCHRCHFHVLQGTEHEIPL